LSKLESIDGSKLNILTHHFAIYQSQHIVFHNCLYEESPKAD
jgi:hypothetical protein